MCAHAYVLLYPLLEITGVSRSIKILWVYNNFPFPPPLLSSLRGRRGKSNTYIYSAKLLMSVSEAIGI